MLVAIRAKKKGTSSHVEEIRRKLGARLNAYMESRLSDFTDALDVLSPPHGPQTPSGQQVRATCDLARTHSAS